MLNEPQRFYLKHQMSCLADQWFDVTIDRDHKEVYVRVDSALDTDLLASLVVSVLPGQAEVIAFRDDNDKVDAGIWLTRRAPYRLFVDFAGRRHLVEVVKLFDGDVSVLLEQPTT